MWPTTMPIRSMVGELPSITEKQSSTHGRNGARNWKRPRKLMRTYSLRRPQTYTIMNASEEPRKGGMLVKGEAAHMRLPPKSSISRKSAGRPRNEPSSSILPRGACGVSGAQRERRATGGGGGRL